MRTEYLPDELRRLPVSSWENIKPVVYVPLPQALPYADEVIPALIEIARQGVPFLHLPYGFADRARNTAADEFLKTGYTHLIMLDSDHIHPVNVVQRLCRWALEPEKAIVGGMNFKRCAPYSPCAYVVNERGSFRLHEWDYGLIEVSAIGFGAVCISRRVFETMPRPWFYHDYSGSRDNPNFVYPGHDLDFCRRAKESGFSVWCDTTCVSPHLTSAHVSEQTYRTYSAGLPEDGETE